MSVGDLVERAARNNARWCDAVCRAHGCPGFFTQDAWANLHQPPPFYGNAVTLTREGVDAQRKVLLDLEQARFAWAWGVKDSFHTLDLGVNGFRLLFDAEWLAHDGSVPDRCDGLEWATLDEASALRGWENAWRSVPGNALPDEQPSIFPAELLADPEIVFLSGTREGAVRAGAILNRYEGVVALSNVFVADEEEPSAVAGVTREALDRFPGAALVTYDSGSALPILVGAGFASLAPLRVWMRDPSA